MKITTREVGKSKERILKISFIIMFITILTTAIFGLITFVIYTQINLDRYWPQRLSFKQKVELMLEIPFFYLSIISFIILTTSFIIIVIIIISSKKVSLSYTGTCLRCEDIITEESYNRFKGKCPKCYRKDIAERIALIIETIWCPIFILITLLMEISR